MQTYIETLREGVDMINHHGKALNVAEAWNRSRVDNSNNKNRGKGREGNDKSVAAVETPAKDTRIPDRQITSRNAMKYRCGGGVGGGGATCSSTAAQPMLVSLCAHSRWLH